MKQISLCIILLLPVFIFLLSCSSEKQTESNTEKQTMQSGSDIDITSDMLTTNTDLVCGMDLRKYTIKDTAIYEGQLYGFCSEYCKKKFMENPEKYLADQK